MQKKLHYLEIEKEAIKSPETYIVHICALYSAKTHIVQETYSAKKITKQERREQIEGETYIGRSRAVLVCGIISISSKSF